MSGQPTLTLGSKSPAVSEVADRLQRIGHLPEQYTPKETFDEELAAAVRHFQQEQGLLVSGLVDDETYRRLEEARWQLGDRVLFFKSGKLMAGEDVVALQHKLQQLGFQPGKIDGLFGRNTESALKEFQKSVGLDTDGISGPSVYRAFTQLTRTVTGGDPARLRADLSHEHFSGVAARAIVLDCQPSDANDPCLEIIARTEGRLAALGSTVVVASGLSASTSAEKAALANRVSADAYLHLAQTSYRSPKAHGCACFYFQGRPGSTSIRGRRLAGLLQDEITSATELLNDRTHGKSWDLLRRTSMPAVQIEIGYQTSTIDNRILTDPTQRDHIALAITQALTKFFQPDEIS